MSIKSFNLPQDNLSVNPSIETIKSETEFYNKVADANSLEEIIALIRFCDFRGIKKNQDQLRAVLETINEKTYEEVIDADYCRKKCEQFKKIEPLYKRVRFLLDDLISKNLMENFIKKIGIKKLPTIEPHKKSRSSESEITKEPKTKVSQKRKPTITEGKTEVSAGDPMIEIKEKWKKQRPDIDQFKKGGDYYEEHLIGAKRINRDSEIKDDQTKLEETLLKIQKSNEGMSASEKNVAVLAENTEYALMEILSQTKLLNGNMQIYPASKFDDVMRRTDFMIVFKLPGGDEKKIFLQFAVDVTISRTHADEKQQKVDDSLKKGHLYEVKYSINKNDKNDVGKKEVLPFVCLVIYEKANELCGLASIPEKDLTYQQQKRIQQKIDEFIEETIFKQLDSYDKLIVKSLKEKIVQIQSLQVEEMVKRISKKEFAIKLENIEYTVNKLKIIKNQIDNIRLLFEKK
jgi:hypothetical protein